VTAIWQHSLVTFINLLSHSSLSNFFADSLRDCNVGEMKGLPCGFSLFMLLIKQFLQLLFLVMSSADERTRKLYFSKMLLTVLKRETKLAAVRRSFEKRFIKPCEIVWQITRLKPWLEWEEKAMMCWTEMAKGNCRT